MCCCNTLHATRSPNTLQYGWVLRVVMFIQCAHVLVFVLDGRMYVFIIGVLFGFETVICVRYNVRSKSNNRDVPLQYATRYTIPKYTTMFKTSP